MLACDFIMEVRASRTVTAQQVAQLENAVPIGSTLIAEELDILFQIDHYAERADASWTRLLARAVLSGVVVGEAPMGVLTENKADWLLEKIGHDRIADRRNLELLARVMARSEATPQWLQQMLVELSGRSREAADGCDARGLQTMLAGAYPTSAEADVAPQEQQDVAQIADVVSVPGPAAATPARLAAAA